ncbi:unnamed protein product, partial [Boreogadus saida]
MRSVLALGRRARASRPCGVLSSARDGSSSGGVSCVLALACRSLALDAVHRQLRRARAERRCSAVVLALGGLRACLALAAVIA